MDNGDKWTSLSNVFQDVVLHTSSTIKLAKKSVDGDVLRKESERAIYNLRRINAVLDWEINGAEMVVSVDKKQYFVDCVALLDKFLKELAQVCNTPSMPLLISVQQASQPNMLKVNALRTVGNIEDALSNSTEALNILKGKSEVPPDGRSFLSIKILTVAESLKTAVAVMKEALYLNVWASLETAMSIRLAVCCY